VTPDVLTLLGDGMPRTEAVVVAELAGRHPTAPASKLSDCLSGSAVQCAFLTAELLFALGLKRELREEIERRVAAHDTHPGAGTAGAW
jgi:hypothetical protein